MTNELKGFRGTPGPYDESYTGLIGRFIEGRRNWTHVATINSDSYIDGPEAAANERLLSKSYELALFVQRVAETPVNIHEQADLIDEARTLLASVIGDDQ